MPRSINNFGGDEKVDGLSFNGKSGVNGEGEGAWVARGGMGGEGGHARSALHPPLGPPAAEMVGDGSAASAFLDAGPPWSSSSSSSSSFFVFSVFPILLLLHRLLRLLIFFSTGA